MPTHRDFLAAYSDSDSEWSSLERQRATDIMGKANKKPSSHKRIRKKRTAIPVATPKVPSLASMGSGDGIVGLNYNMKDDKNWRVDPADRGAYFSFFFFFLTFICVYIYIFISVFRLQFCIVVDSDSTTMYKMYLPFQCRVKHPTLPNRVIRSIPRDPDRNNISTRRLVCGKDSLGIRCSSSICNTRSM